MASLQTRCTTAASRAVVHKPSVSCRPAPSRSRSDAVPCYAQHQQASSSSISMAKDEGAHAPARRQVLMAAAVLAFAWGGNSTAPALAEDVVTKPPPKEYQELVLTLCKSLRDALDAEQAGESEADIRRKADPAKNALMQFVRRWRGDFQAKKHPSHPQVSALLTELGGFYQQNGPRARLPDDLRGRVRGYIGTAEQSFEVKKQPVEPKPAAPPSILRGSGEDELRELLPAA